MADDFLGVGFDFGARDVGFEAAMDSAMSNLDQVNDMMDEQNESTKESTSLWKKMSGVYKKTASAMSGFATKFNIAAMAENVRNLSGETGNLTNELEAMGVANAKATKPIIAGMDLTASEMRKLNSQASGLAISLNTDAAAVANSMKAIKTAGEPAKEALDSMGMSTKDWQKVVETTGVDMQDYVAMLGDMKASWGATNEEATGMIDNVVALGKKMKVGTTPLKNMKQQLDAIDVIFEKLPPGMARSAGEIQELMETTVKAAGAFKEMGETEEGAVAMANETAKMFAEQAVQIEKLYAVGGEGALDDSPLFKFITQLGVGTEEARDIIRTGSVDVVKGMSRINDLFVRFGGDTSPQVQHALSGLSEAMGGSAAGLGFLAQSATVGKNALATVAATSVDGQNALKKFGKQAFSSGRTLQETYDLARESFDTTIRSIARKDVRGFVGLQIKGMREAGKEIKALGSDETWGPWVKAMSNVRQMGVGGLFASFAQQTGGKKAVKNAAKLGAKFNAIFDTVKQLGGELAPVMELLGMAGPLGPLLAGGGIAGLLMLDDATAKNLLGPMYEAFAGMKRKFKELWDKFGPRIKDAWENQVKPKLLGVWDDVKEKIKTAWREDIFPEIKNMWENDFIPWIKETAPQLGGAIWEGIKEGWSMLDTKGKLLVGGIVSGVVLGSQGGGGLLGAFGKGAQSLAGAMGSKGIIGAALIGTIAIGGTMLVKAIMKIKKEIRDLMDQSVEDIGKHNKFMLESGMAMRSHIQQMGVKDLAIAMQDEGVRKEVQAMKKKTRVRDMTWMAGQGVSDAGWTGPSNFQEVFNETLAKRYGFESEMVQKDKWDALWGRLKEVQNIPEIRDRLEEIQKQYVERGKTVEAAEDMTMQLMGLQEGLLEGAQWVETQAQAQEAAKTRQMLFQAETLASQGGLVSSDPDRARLEVAEASLKFNELAIAANQAGIQTGDEFAAGLKASEGKLNEAATGAAQQVDNVLGAHSPIVEGLLAGTGEANAVYRGGAMTMMEFGDGIYSQAQYVRQAVEDVMNDSVMLTMHEFNAKMQEQTKNMNIMKSVASDIVRSLGGKIETSVDVAGEPENVKAAFEAALSVPGLAGVTLAIVQEGAKTRRVLGKILEENQKQTSMMTGEEGGGVQVVLPS